MSNTKSKKSTGIIVAIIVLVVLLGAAAIAYFKFAPDTNEGSKAITIEVVDNEQTSVVYDVKTDAEYLRGAMDEAKGLEYSGTDSDYGLMVSTVNGVTADYNVDASYWAFYINGEYCNYGIDTQPIADGDAFQIVYTTD